MAHLGPQTTAAIFSPSVARAAASAAKDWSHVDAWLRTKYQGQKVPEFERNPETLKALLALASHNEAADEERQKLARIEEAALREVQDAEREDDERRRIAAEQGRVDGALVADDMLQATEEHLTREGRTALSAMANMAVELTMACPSPDDLAARFIQLQGKVFALEQTIDRVGLLQKYLDRESQTMDDFIDHLQGDEYRPAADLAKQNLELQRQIKTMSAKLPEISQQVASLEKTIGMPALTVEDARKDEERYLKLLARKRELDAKVHVFAGLPPNVDAARAELDALRTELRHATGQRDAVFEGLVERESPVKSRRRP